MDTASIGEEIQDPERNLPRVGVIGLTVVSSVYLCLNLAYLMVLPADVIAHGSTSEDSKQAMGVFFARTVAGRYAGLAVTVVVALSSFGALNSCMYLSARQFYASARVGFSQSRSLGERETSPARRHPRDRLLDRRVDVRRCPRSPRS